MKIGVLALQGAFIEHVRMLDELGVVSFEIRQLRDIENGFDGLIIPGGESTVMGKLMRESGLLLPLKARIEGGLPVFGTCAGLILLSKKISSGNDNVAGTEGMVDIEASHDGISASGAETGAFLSPGTPFSSLRVEEYLATLDITAKRNAYGRQSGSFRTLAEFKEIGQIPMTFIRAPYIAEVGKKVAVLAVVNGHIVAARQDNQLVTAFHPELDRDLSVHRYFINLITNYQNQ